MHGDAFAEHVGIDLYHERVVVRQSAGGDELPHGHAAFAKPLDNPAQSKRRGFEQRTVEMRRAMMERESGERAPERSIHERRAAAVEPIDAPHAIRTGRQRGSLASELHEITLAGHPAQPVERITHRRLSGFVAVVAGENSILHHARYTGDAALHVTVEHVAGTGAHDQHERARFRRARAGHTGVRVDDGRADRRACAQAELLRHRAGESARRDARREQASGHFVFHDPRELWMHRVQKLLGRITLRRAPHSFVTRLTGRARQRFGGTAHELPDEPVTRFEPDLRCVVGAWCEFECLQHFGEEPFQPDAAAVALEKTFPAFARHGVDAVGLRLRAVMLPQLRPSERFGRERLEQTQRRAVPLRRQHGATREIHAHAEHILAANLGLTQRSPRGFRRRLHPVERMLERVVWRKFLLRSGQCLGDLSVRILRDDGGPFPPAQIHEDGADRLRAEVEAECEARCESGHTGRKMRAGRLLLKVKNFVRRLRTHWRGGSGGKPDPRIRPVISHRITSAAERCVARVPSLGYAL